MGDILQTSRKRARTGFEEAATHTSAAYLYHSALSSSAWTGALSLSNHRVWLDTLGGVQPPAGKIIEAAQRLAARDGFSMTGVEKKDSGPCRHCSYASNGQNGNNGLCRSCGRFLGRLFEIDVTPKERKTDDVAAPS